MDTKEAFTRTEQTTAALQEAGDIKAEVPPGCSSGCARVPDRIGKAELRNTGMPRSLHSGHGSDATLHELASSVTAVLINAQVLEWKLPPYSQWKHAAREIERHAQRSAVLLKRLLGEFETTHDGSEFCLAGLSLRGRTTAVTAQGPEALDGGPVNLPSPAPLPAVPGFFPERELTSPCDLCTSAFFPKEERLP